MQFTHCNWIDPFAIKSRNCEKMGGKEVVETDRNGLRGTDKEMKKRDGG